MNLYVPPRDLVHENKEETENADKHAWWPERAHAAVIRAAVFLPPPLIEMVRSYAMPLKHSIIVTYRRKQMLFNLETRRFTHVRKLRMKFNSLVSLARCQETGHIVGLTRKDSEEQIVVSFNPGSQKVTTLAAKKNLFLRFLDDGQFLVNWKGPKNKLALLQTCRSDLNDLAPADDRFWVPPEMARSICIVFGDVSFGFRTHEVFQMKEGIKSVVYQHNEPYSEICKIALDHELEHLYIARQDQRYRDYHQTLVRIDLKTREHTRLPDFREDVIECLLASNGSVFIVEAGHSMWRSRVERWITVWTLGKGDWKQCSWANTGYTQSHLVDVAALLV